MKALHLSDIFAARQRIKNDVLRTPIKQALSLSGYSDKPIYLKLEHHQYTGSFKLRGATNAVKSLSLEQRKKGVIGVSTGNHGRGLAFAAKNNQVDSIIAMSQLVPQNKVDAIKALGSDVRIIGQSQDDAQLEVDRLVAEQGMSMLPPFDHPDVICGQGTLALEIIEDVADIETMIVPLSGGGLLSGIALAMKTINPAIRVIGVSMERGCAMFESQKAGKPVQVKELATLADSLGGGIGLDNQYTFVLVEKYVDDLVLVDEAAIANAIRHAYVHEQEVIEGSGSVGIAAILSEKIKNPGRCVILTSGKNIDMAMHQQIINGEMPIL